MSSAMNDPPWKNEIASTLEPKVIGCLVDAAQLIMEAARQAENKEIFPPLDVALRSLGEAIVVATGATITRPGPVALKPR